jgi:hypothetical protein
MSEQTNYTNKGKFKLGLIIPLSLLLLLILALIAYLLFFKESKNFSDGIKALKAQLYDEAYDRFKICLIESPNDPKVKGLLLLSLAVKNKTEDDLIFEYFEKYLTLSVYPKMKFNFSSREHFNSFNYYVESSRRQIRELMKNNGVRTENWEEVENIVENTAEVIFNQDLAYIQDLQPYAICSAIILARKGDKKAQKFLIDLAIWNEKYAKYIEYPGQEMIKTISKEIENRESLLYNEGIKTLRKLKIYQKIKDLLKKHPDVRRPYPRPTDFSDTSEYRRTFAFKFEEGKRYLKFDPEMLLYPEGDFDPLSFDIRITPAGENLIVGSITTYDDKAKNFITKFYLWSQNDWKDVKNFIGNVEYDVINSRNYPLWIEIDPNRNLLLIGYGKYLSEPVYKVEERVIGYVLDPKEGWVEKKIHDTILIRYNEKFIVDRWDIYDINVPGNSIQLISNSNNYREKIKQKLTSIISNTTTLKDGLKLTLTSSDTSSAEASFILLKDEPKTDEKFYYMPGKIDSAKGDKICVLATGKIPGKDPNYPINIYIVKKLKPDTTYFKELN